MRTFLKRYRIALLTAVGLCIALLLFPELVPDAGGTLLRQARTMLLVLPPIFILLGLFDVWVPRETIIRHMGDDSILLGSLLAFLLGSAAAGPLYGAFPVAAVLIKKGANFFTVLIFIGAWSTTKIPMFLFEINALGARFAVSRLLTNIIGILIIAFIIQWLVPRREVEALYRSETE